MKKIIIVFSVLCVLLCGCSLQETSNVDIGDIGVYKYDVDNVTLLRKINNLRLYIYLDQLNGNPETTVRLFTREGELLVENEKEGMFLSDIELEFSKDREELKLIERITYYDQNDRENNFTYDKVTELSYQDIKGGFRINIPNENSVDIKWDVVNNIKSLQESMELGVYNLYEVSYLVGIFTMFVCTLITAFILFMRYRYTLLKEKKFKYEPTINIITGLLIFFLLVIMSFEGEPVIIIIVIDALLILPFIAKLIVMFSKLDDAKKYELVKASRMEKLDDIYKYKKL